jgi:hypothetical protein
VQQLFPSCLVFSGIEQGSAKSCSGRWPWWCDAQERDPGLRRRRVRRQPGHRQPPLGPAAPADRRRPRGRRPRPLEVVGRGTVLVDGTVSQPWRSVRRWQGQPSSSNSMAALSLAAGTSWRRGRTPVCRSCVAAVIRCKVTAGLWLAPRSAGGRTWPGFVDGALCITRMAGLTATERASDRRSVAAMSQDLFDST